MPEGAARRSDTTSVECSGNALQSSDTGRVDVAYHGNDVGGELIRLGAVAGDIVSSCCSLLLTPRWVGPSEFLSASSGDLQCSLGAG
jgi:hypothetical protein